MAENEYPQVRSIKTELPGPLSAKLAARKQEAVSAGVSTQNPIYCKYAGGGVIVDVDGNSFIDLGSGIAVTTVGASNPRVVKAVQEQVADFTHTCFMVTPYAGYVEVCELLNRITPGDFEKSSALFNSGAEAVENAVKVARAFTGKTAVAAFEYAYHGRTNLTMAMTSKAHPYKSGFGPFATEVYRMPMSNPYRDGLDGKAAAKRTINWLTRQIGAENLACVVIETIQGEGGFIVPAPGYLKELLDWCHANGVVFIADEVQCGYGRTGKMFACEWEDIVPDVICTAKGIAGGMPLSAVTGRKEIMDAAQPGGLGGTYGGNPVACAAALAVGEAFEQDGLLEKALEIEKVMKSRLEEMQKHDIRIGEVRGRGAMIAIELNQDDGITPNPELAKHLKDEMYRKGIIILTCGTEGNVIRFLPPLTIPMELLEEALDELEKSLKEAK